MTTTTTATKQAPTRPLPTRPESAGAPPAANDAAASEPSLGSVARDAAESAASVVADHYLRLTGLRPGYDVAKDVWRGATRVWHGEPIAEVARDAIISRPARDVASLVGAIDTMKDGDELSTTVELTGALEGVAARQEAELRIERTAHGYRVTLADSRAAGALAAEKHGAEKVEAGAFARAGLGLTFEVATAAEAKELAGKLALTHVIAGAPGEALWVAHPGLREVELSVGALAEAGIGAPVEAGVGAPSPGELGELGVEATAAVNARARFVDGSPPELVLSYDAALAAEAAASIALGKLELGGNTEIEGKVTKEVRFALPPGTTAADLPTLLAGGEVLRQAPRERWTLEATARGPGGKELVVEGTVRVGEHGAALHEGSVEWRNTKRPRVGGGEMHQGSGGEARVTVERSTLVRREEFSSPHQLGRALYAMRGDVMRAP